MLGRNTPRFLKSASVGSVVFLLSAFIAGCGSSSGGQSTTAPAHSSSGQNQTSQSSSSQASSTQNMTPAQIYASLANLSPKAREQKLYTEAKKEGEVVGYVTGGVSTWEKVRKAFEKKYPGVTFKYYRARDAQVTQKILTEAQAGKLQADLLKVSGINVLQAKHLLAPYSSPAFKPIPKKYYGKDWFAMATTPILPVYNTNMISPANAPKSWQDLLNPKWKGKIAMDVKPDKTMRAMYVKWGRTKAKAYLTKLLAQNLIPQHSHTTAIQKMAAGEFPIVAEAFGYKAAEMKIKNHAPIGFIMADPIGNLVEAAGIYSHAPHPYAAALFVDFLLSPAGQKAYGSEGRDPVNPNVKPLYPILRTIDNSPNTVMIGIPQTLDKVFNPVTQDISKWFSPAILKKH